MITTYANSVDREAIEMPGAAGLDQLLLAAPRAHVSGVPRGVAAAGAVGMTKHRPCRNPRGVRVIARHVRVGRSPIVAGVVDAVGESAAIGVRPRQDVVLVRHVARAFDRLALLIQGGSLLDVVAIALLIAMQVGDARRDHGALCTV